MRFVSPLLAAVLLVGCAPLTVAQESPPAPNTPDIACAQPAQISDSAGDRAAWDEALRRSLALRDTHQHATGAGVKVAVVDTGVAQHPRLRITPGADFIHPEQPRADHDCDSHGTVVAGIIGMRPDPSSDELTGIAPDAEILSIRHTSAHYRSPQRDSSGNLANLAEAIDAAIDAKADVINVSVVSCVSPARAAGLNTRALRAAVRRAEASNVVVVAAAGNASERCSPGDVVYPAHLPTVIAVSAVDHSARSLAEYTLPAAEDTGLQLSATGDVPIALHSEGSGLASGVYRDEGQVHGYIGTSFAAPIVSGAVALLLQRDRHASPAEIRARLATIADPARGEFDIHAVLTHLDLDTRTSAAERDITIRTAQSDPTRNRVAIMAAVALAAIALRAIIRGWRSDREA
ncbi:S8 family serine peptidase [Corynebacterium sp. TAE3-ERU30]|uniref:S8 family serine peptidase n=1 Tax=Corynebacterium sp. TAE3-ERU30 TaxID=2849496 RepID=UPI002102D59D|nr:S8 family serine peptidase [Corynebacterium sp. TAE3-ERU30]